MTPSSSLHKQLDAVQDRFGLKAASYLSLGISDHSHALPHDVTERLRAARAQAVAKRKVARLQTAPQVVNNGGSAAMTWGSGERFGWWAGIGSVVPLIALVVGMLVINNVQSDNRTQELAEVDAALLLDELPPAAFTDAGFVQFLKSER
jgi:Protein of unknown function (DUF3619)